MKPSEIILSAPLQKSSISESVYGIGTVFAEKRFDYKAGVTNTLDDVFIKEGDSVTAGQKLIRLGSIFVTAPFDGVVTSLPSKVGENIFASSVVLSLVDLTQRYIVV